METETPTFQEITLEPAKYLRKGDIVKIRHLSGIYKISDVLPRATINKKTRYVLESLFTDDSPLKTFIDSQLELATPAEVVKWRLEMAKKDK